ncbi:unnamed protein product [Chrysodeixis includens]|uniref:Uncharacterized protein n=1 Tax=Chrysodeixis includens TaxID=689277 RepID=A0A9N8KRV3_CHRIL|nr:unnamed protein product [Chrysodeixis includens]
MSPSSTSAFTWSGWCRTSCFKNGAASNGLRLSASNSARLNSADRKSGLRCTAALNHRSAHSASPSSMHTMPRLKWTRSFVASLSSSFKRRCLAKCLRSAAPSSCSRMAEFKSACSCSGSNSNALSK